MTLCLYPAQSGSLSPHSSQTPFLILVIADARPRAGAGGHGSYPSLLPGVAGAVLLGLMKIAVLVSRGRAQVISIPSIEVEIAQGQEKERGEKG